MLSPIEIKKSASPGKAAIKNFNVLKPVTKESAFEGLESLKVEIGTGSVICMASDLLPVDGKKLVCAGLVNLISCKHGLWLVACINQGRRTNIGTTARFNFYRYVIICT